MNNAENLNDLPPKIMVFTEQKKEGRVDPVHTNMIEYSDETLRVIKMYDVAASPYQGQWVIRIDTYEQG